MRISRLLRAICTIGIFAFTASIACAQAAAPQPALTPAQQQLFAAARQDFGQQHFTDSLAKMRALHEQVPANSIITEATAETAITAGDPQYAISILKPLEAAADGYAITFLVRAYAETHQNDLRDAEIKTLLELHKTTTDPRFKQLQQFLLERVSSPPGHVDIYYSLVPWGRYNIYAMARVFNATGQQQFRITLESNDPDQPLWANQHPDLAAKGIREFSLDGYSEPQPGANGASTQTHATYGFLNGQPTYDDLRQRMLTIAGGKSGPMSTTTGIPMPKQ
jgi:hypothetical protein